MQDHLRQGFLSELTKLGEDPDDGIDAGKAVAVGAAAGLPFLGLLGQETLIHDPTIHPGKVPSFKSLGDLERAALPGDILVTAKNKRSVDKLFQSSFFGSEFSHAQMVGDARDVPGVGKRLTTISITDPLHKPELRSQSREQIKQRLGLLSDELKRKKYSDVVLLRAKKPLTPEVKQRMVDASLDRARRGYDADRGVRSWIKDIFVPKVPLAEKLYPSKSLEYETKVVDGKKVKVPKFCVGDMCSTLPASVYEDVAGVKMTRGKGPGGVMPADLLRSRQMEAVGSYGPRAYTVRKFQPYMTRGGLGLGLAGATAAAYEDPALLGGVAGFAGGSGLSKLVLKDRLPSIAHLKESLVLESPEVAKAVKRRFWKYNIPAKLLGAVGGYEIARRLLGDEE